jgi:photosystem II stability/assembly factor-like uncharacterized protein
MKPKILKMLFVVFSVLILINIDSFSQWVQLTTNTTENLLDIYFSSYATGVAVGSNGKIVRTTDGGQTWFTVTSGTPHALYSLDFPDIMTGFTGGTTGTVLRTLNGGASWTPRTGCGINISSISFFNVNTGITAGGGTLMCFTTDAGTNWNPRYSPNFAVTSAVFISAETLLIACTDLPGAAIFKSSNTGNNWISVLSLNNSGVDIVYSLSYICFKDNFTGFCAGSHIYYSQTWGDVYMTTNGGINWEITGGSGPLAGSAMHGVHFGVPNTGFAVGNNGVILHTSNGGLNWISQSSGTSNSLNAVYMLNELTGYACGNNGMVLKTTNGGVTGFIKTGKHIPDKFALYQNYPNPFNPATIINYDITITGFVRLSVYDVLGREVSTIVNQTQSPGKYQVEWDASNYPSGVYFYKLVVSGAKPLITAQYTETKKMVLIK